MHAGHFLIALCVLAAVPAMSVAQLYDKPDAASPGDAMIQAYLQREAAKLSARFSDDITSRENWETKRPAYLHEYYDMLGLWPMPDKTPLKATVTRTLNRGDYVIDMLHYQSRPGLYVTANLYRPAATKEGDKLPAILYVCGHSGRGRNGNKVAYQSHGIWFARHGYVCLIVDTLQLGEIAATHHGTYNLQRWWWHSRGYTPAGVEAWNGIRGIDYLTSRSEVDAGRIAVTGISGGGAATYWITAADERVKVAVPVSGMSDLESYVSHRVIDGHCDCMFFYNARQWPWTRIAGLIAPRPMLFVNSDQDAIFPMDGNERIINRLERLYSLYGASDDVGAVVSVGGHAYRKDIRRAAYRFLNTHLKNDPRLVSDSEVELVSEGNAKPSDYPIAPESLRVFPNDSDLPVDQVNTKIDEQFVPLGQPAAPLAGAFDAWKRDLLTQLRRTSLGYFPDSIPPAKKVGDVDADTERLQSEDGIELRLRYRPLPAGGARSVLLVVLNESEAGTTPEWIKTIATESQAVVLCEPRGVGATRWTHKNPPNYVERSLVLLGRTVDTGRVWDVIASAKSLRGNSRLGGKAGATTVQVAGSGAAGAIAAYAAALDAEIAGVTVVAPSTTHMDSTAPQLLGVLRVCDVPDVLGLIAPRPLRLVQTDAKAFARTLSYYEAAGAKDAITFK